MNLLIVDDSTQMRRAIRSMVADTAERVHECADGTEALAAYAEHRPDWVLMDVKMEGTDGLTATREIRRAFPEARVIIVTNYDDDELREEAQSAGACAFVVKSNLLDLRRIIRASQSDAQH